MAAIVSVLFKFNVLAVFPVGRALEPGVIVAYFKVIDIELERHFKFLVQLGAQGVQHFGAFPGVGGGFYFIILYGWGLGVGLQRKQKQQEDEVFGLHGDDDEKVRTGAYKAYIFNHKGHKDFTKATKLSTLRPLRLSFRALCGKIIHHRSKSDSIKTISDNPVQNNFNARALQ